VAAPALRQEAAVAAQPAGQRAAAVQPLAVAVRERPAVVVGVVRSAVAVQPAEPAAVAADAPDAIAAAVGHWDADQRQAAAQVAARAVRQPEVAVRQQLVASAVLPAVLRAPVQSQARVSWAPVSRRAATLSTAALVAVARALATRMQVVERPVPATARPVSVARRHRLARRAADGCRDGPAHPDAAAPPAARRPPAESQSSCAAR
jgi:hypothetical protein